MMPSAPICRSCGHAIHGTYIVALGAEWHPEHFLCSACGQSIGYAGFCQHQGEPYHWECYRRTLANRCSYCGRALMGEYLVDHRGTKFCPEHLGEFPPCRFCGCLVPPHHQASDCHSEGVRCPKCRAVAIDYMAQARPIFAKLQQWVSAQGLVYGNLKLRIELRNRRQLGQLLSEFADTRALGAMVHTTYTKDGRVLWRAVQGVAILRGLPTTLFQGVTVHELGHCWLAVHGVTDLPCWAEEGFCELLAHRFYVQINTPESRFFARQIEQQNDPVYGQGFRRLRARAEATGFQRLIEALRRNVLTRTILGAP